MPPFFTLIFMLVTLAFMPVYLSWINRRGKEMVDQWAHTHALRVIDCHRVWFPPWKLFWTTSKSQIVMRVRVWDAATQKDRVGWLRVGSYWWGVLGQSECEAFWD